MTFRVSGVTPEPTTGGASDDARDVRTGRKSTFSFTIECDSSEYAPLVFPAKKTDIGSFTIDVPTTACAPTLLATKRLEGSLLSSPPVRKRAAVL